jgi:O-acetylserine/cysteine efflux transporter
LTLTAMRFAVAVLLLFLCTIGKPTLALKALPRAGALGVLGIGVGQVAQAFGIQGTTASVGTIISATIPIFVVVFAALRLGQRVTRRQQFGLLAAFLGIGLVALGQEQDGASMLVSGLAGTFWMLLSAVAISFYYVWSVELTSEYDTVAVAAWSTLFGFLALLPWCVWEISRTSFQVTPAAVGAAVYLGVAVSVAGLFLWLHILKTVSAPVAASVQYLQPVFGIAAAAVMFGDRLGLPFGAGVVLILAGLALAVASQRKAEEAVPHE